MTQDGAKDAAVREVLGADPAALGTLLEEYRDRLRMMVLRQPTSITKPAGPPSSSI